MKKFVSEFKEFISRGNVVDLAVGMIVGSAFTAIVSSLVNEVVMPVVGMLFHGIDFTTLRYVITPATEDMAESAIRYGNFIQAVVNFLLVSLVVFTAVRAINRLRRKKEEPAPAPEPAPEPEPSEEILLLREIRDLMKK